jgi:hypothetical protein
MSSQPEGLNQCLPPVREMVVPCLSSLDQRVTDDNWCNCLCFWTPAALFTPKNWICCIFCGGPLIPCCCNCYDEEGASGGGGGGGTQTVVVNVNK